MGAGNRKSVVASLRWKELQESPFRARAGAAPLKLGMTIALSPR